MSADYFPDAFFAASYWPAGFYGPEAIVVADEMPRGPAQPRRKRSKVAWWLDEQRARFDEPIQVAALAAVQSVVAQAPAIPAPQIVAMAMRKAAARHLAAQRREAEIEAAITQAAASWRAHRHKQAIALLLLG